MSKVASLLREKAAGLREQASYNDTFNQTVLEKVAEEMGVSVDEASELLKQAENPMMDTTPSAQAGDIISFLLQELAQNSSGGPVKSFAQSWAGKDYSNSEGVRTLLNAMRSRGFMKQAEETVDGEKLGVEGKEAPGPYVLKFAAEALVRETGIDMDQATALVKGVQA